MYGVENRFKMLFLLGLKRPHCGMIFQQLSTTSEETVLPPVPVEEDVTLKQPTAEECSVTITVTFGHFGAIRLKGCAKTLHNLALFQIP